MGLEATQLMDLAMVGKSTAGALQTIGSYSQAKGHQQGLEAQAAVARNNAQYANWQGDDAVERGKNEVARTQLRISQTKGAQRASMASRGLDLTFGTPLELLEDTDFLGKTDIATINDNFAKEAWAFRQQAGNYEANAGILRAQSSRISPAGAAGLTLLTGATSVASDWYRYAEFSGRK
jgi:hypothetical protein